MKNRSKTIFTSILCLTLTILFTNVVFGQNMFRKVNDFDGDGKADFAVTRDINGFRTWYILQTTDGFRAEPFGIDIDLNAAGDFDGDGKYDLGIWRKQPTGPTTMSYFFSVNQSQLGVSTFWFPVANAYVNSIPYQQDYNGDGLTDRSWTIDTNNTRFVIKYFPDMPGWELRENPTSPPGEYIKIGDIDGDGKAEAAVYNPSNYLVTIRLSSNNSLSTIYWGTAGDKFVAADWDGDGKGDLSVFRESNGNWYWIRSSDGAFNAAQWGTAGDVPVPADYDGDGKTDLAVWRPGSQSYYFVYGSQDGAFGLPWGIATDKVIQY